VCFGERLEPDPIRRLTFGDPETAASVAPIESVCPISPVTRPARYQFRNGVARFRDPTQVDSDRCDGLSAQRRLPIQKTVMSQAAGTSDLNASLDNLVQLRPFPATASRLMSACDDPSVTAKQIGDIIRYDPTLAVSLLQLANSPIYGFTGEILSVEHATVVLGLRALKNLAVSLAVAEVFGDGDSRTAATRKQLWDHAIACGSIAQTLSLRTGKAVADEAFFAGVVHDIGKLLLMDHRPCEYMAIIAAEGQIDKVEREEATFGMAHTTVGGTCGRSWGLPDDIADVILFHHAPNEADFGGDLIDIVSVANRLTRIWEADSEASEQNDAKALLLEIGVDLSHEEVAELQQQAITNLALTREAHSTS